MPIQSKQPRPMARSSPDDGRCAPRCAARPSIRSAVLDAITLKRGPHLTGGLHLFFIKREPMCMRASLQRRSAATKRHCAMKSRRHAAKGRSRHYGSQTINSQQPVCIVALKRISKRQRTVCVAVLPSPKRLQVCASLHCSASGRGAGTGRCPRGPRPSSRT